MTIRHHPDIATLAAFAYGSLDKGRAFVVAAHVHRCASCRNIVRTYEQSAGLMLEDTPPADMSAAAADKILGLVLHDAGEKRLEPLRPQAEVELGNVLSTYQAGPWRWMGPGVRYRSLADAPAGEARLFLLKAAPGTSLPDHSHSGTELTLVLTGAFSHQGGRFGPGDIEEADTSVEHQPVVEDGDTCICLVAMDGQLRLKGLMGKLLQPFLRL
jgi:putative transcriptional regulator